MTHQQILERAITLAVDNGFDMAKALGRRWDNDSFELHTDPRAMSLDAYSNSGGLVYWLIFSHGFARALWGDWDIVETGRVYNADGTLDNGQTITAFAGKNWEYHLQMMVVAKDPIAYLGENLPS